MELLSFALQPFHCMKDLSLLTTPQTPYGSFRYSDPMSFSARPDTNNHDTHDHCNAYVRREQDVDWTLEWR